MNVPLFKLGVLDSLLGDQDLSVFALDYFTESYTSVDVVVLILQDVILDRQTDGHLITHRDTATPRLAQTSSLSFEKGSLTLKNVNIRCKLYAHLVLLIR